MPCSSSLRFNRAVPLLIDTVEYWKDLLTNNSMLHFRLGSRDLGRMKGKNIYQSKDVDGSNGPYLYLRDLSHLNKARPWNIRVLPGILGLGSPFVI
jgi:hypothetical protein